MGEVKTTFLIITFLYVRSKNVLSKDGIDDNSVNSPIMLSIFKRILCYNTVYFVL